MAARNIQCIVADQATAVVYDVSADYRDVCSYSHDSRMAHLCQLTVRARPLLEPEVSLTACDIAAIPTPVLVAIQTELRVLLGEAAGDPIARGAVLFEVSTRP